MPVMHAPPALTQHREDTQLDLLQHCASVVQPVLPTPMHCTWSSGD